MGSDVTTSPVAVLEIAKIRPTRGDFERRRRAMQALDFIQPLIHEKTPDDILAQAFGQVMPVTVPIDYFSIIRTILLAGSYEEAVKGVKDPFYHVLRRIDPPLLEAWKGSCANYFTHEVIAGDKKQRKVFESLLQERYPDLDRKQLASRAKELSCRTSRHKAAYLYTLVGLSVRAGLHTESQLSDALRSDDIDSLVESAKRKYDGSLDTYIKMYLAFREYLSEGRSPEKNALFDLEFLLHLDVPVAGCIFVTTEELWLRLGESVIPGRVVALDSVLSVSC